VERVAKFLGKREGISRQLGKKTPSVHVKPAEFLRYAELKDNDKGTELYLKKPHGYYYDLAADGKILQIRDGRKGECLFFEKGSCTIYPVRPLVCRVYPFWFSEKGNIIADNNCLDCPIVCGKKPLNKSPSAAATKAGIRKIGYTENELKRLLSQLRKEMEEYRKNIGSFVRKSGI
jgi:Fe-S-cluster containining protein